MKTKPDIKNHFVIIMAGGRGERFWPVSREKTPKQLITLLGNRSFLQQTVDRVLPLVPVKNILVITNETQSPEVRKQLPKLPEAMAVSDEAPQNLKIHLRGSHLTLGREVPRQFLRVVAGDKQSPIGLHDRIGR